MIDVADRSNAEGGRTRLFEDPKTVHLALPAGEEIPPHRHPGTDIVLAVTAGELTLTVGDESAPLGPGQVARFPGDEDIALEAETDASALLVLVN